MDIGGCNVSTLVVYVPDHKLALSLEVQSALSPKNSPVLHQKQQHNSLINSLVPLSVRSALSSHRYNILIYKQYFHSHCSGYISIINGNSYSCSNMTAYRMSISHFRSTSPLMSCIFYTHHSPLRYSLQDNSSSTNYTNTTLSSVFHHSNYNLQ